MPASSTFADASDSRLPRHTLDSTTYHDHLTRDLPVSLVTPGGAGFAGGFPPAWYPSAGVPLSETVENVEGTTTKSMGTFNVSGEAEALIRCLTGVVHASVHAGIGGIEAIRVTAADEMSARAMPDRIRSALLAGLATPVLPGRIFVRTLPQTASDSEQGDDAAATRSPGPCDRGPRLVATSTLLGQDPATAAFPELGGIATEVMRRAPDYIARPHLVAVDLDRPGDGRVVCCVSVAYGAHVHRAEATAIDLPGAAAQAAAQATVGALVDAGLEGLELGGLREVEIAGRDYVLVALRRTDTCPRHRSGSALVLESPERAAARATVAAANEIL